MVRAVAEWLGKTADTAIPRRVRDRVRDRDGNACKGCSRPLGNERAECDHVRSLINGGENREGNLQTLCQWCHGKKTKSDVAIKSKSYKRRVRHRGEHRAKQPFKGWRLMDGTAKRNPKLERRQP